ncbi:hypothetical protein [Sporosarcina sp. JAI121]|uniref:hypothetical protein n=1 Tax=Sporosarcina sp. JAI121 TaxID=2723064 RepID=UPI0015C8D3D0|nr:hypothetical protein [Sporosarcina sp. JAI121]NYF23768.1 hypothetical protein [Sporosarcina sp. JAI121]
MRIEDIYFDEAVKRREIRTATIRRRDKKVRSHDSKEISGMVKRLLACLSFFRRE